MTLVVTALAIGTVLGVVGGRVAWSPFIRNIGINAAPVLPWTGLAVLIVASLAIAIGVATIPALLASRTHPAAALRDR